MNTDVERQDDRSPKSYTDEAVNFFHWIFRFFSPPLQDHPFILLPILCALLPAVFLSVLLYGTLIPNCPQDFSNTCVEALVSISWGGFIVGNMDPGRFLTYSLMHLSFTHISTNVVVLFISLYYLERKYGFWRLFLVYLSAVAGGAILSWLWLPNGEVVAGASGGIYGFIFLYFVDLIINWKTISMPHVELIMPLVGLVALIINGAIETQVAVSAHIGGGLVSLSMGFLILPHFYHRKYEVLIPIVGFLTLCLEFILTPLLLMKYKS